MNFQYSKLIRSALLLLTLLVSQSVLAHTLGESYARVDWRKSNVTVAYNMRSDQFLQLSDPRFFSGATPMQVFEQEVMSNYHFTRGATPCEKLNPSSSEHGGFFRITFDLSCSTSGPLTLTNNAFFELLPDHLHFLRVNLEGAFIAEKVMEAINNTWQIPAASDDSQNLIWDYGVLGAEHIFFGYDHLAFLLTLLLLVQGIGRIAVAVTGFTIGHSISLVLTVLGYTLPDITMIEALIGLTIALVAMEVVFKQRHQLALYGALVLATSSLIILASLVLENGPSPLAMIGICVFYACYLMLSEQQTRASPVLLLTVLFGFIHGFGFAASLIEIGLPTEQLALSLLAFNLGIEAAQLAFVMAIIAAIQICSRLIPQLAAYKIWQPTLASALAGLGLFWFVTRAWS